MFVGVTLSSFVLSFCSSTTKRRQNILLKKVQLSGELSAVPFERRKEACIILKIDNSGGRDRGSREEETERSENDCGRAGDSRHLSPRCCIYSSQELTLTMLV